jgi:N-acetylglucosamine-6-phosphate deacetylase
MTTAEGVLRGSVVLTPDGPLVDGEVRIEGGLVVGVGAASGPVPDQVVAPGFVDLQVNGIDDVDCTTAGPDDWGRADGVLASSGVTAWLATLVSQPLERYARPLASIAAAMVRTGPRPAVVGAHLEGPFLGGRRGAHREEHVVPVDLAWLDELPDAVRLVTLAPEQPHAAAATERLVARGVLVSLGHSAAGLDDVGPVVGAGARMVTHLFNGMEPLHHRRPGLVGAALGDDRLAVGLIADTVHVHPALFPVVFRAKGAGRVVLVSDAIGWRTGRLARSDVAVVEGAPRLPDGTLAGSVLTMDAAVRNVVDAGVALPDAVAAASATPAMLLGDRLRGRLAVGARADAVVLDAGDLEVCRTVVAGETVFER